VRPFVSEAALRGTVESCFASVPLPENGGDEVRVSIASTLRLEVAEDGAIRSAVFAPPLKPELQSCAEFVLRSRLAPGARRVAIDVRAR
jgi:hypothetical protein